MLDPPYSSRKAYELTHLLVAPIPILTTPLTLLPITIDLFSFDALFDEK